MSKRSAPAIVILLTAGTLRLFGQSSTVSDNAQPVLLADVLTRESLSDLQTDPTSNLDCLEPDENEFSTKIWSPERITPQRTSFDVTPAAAPPWGMIQSNADWTTASVLGTFAITAGLVLTDQHTYNAVQSWHHGSVFVQDVSPKITYLGDGVTSLSLFGGFMAYSLLADDKKSFEVGKIGLESFVVSGFASQLLKHLFGRERPSVATRSGGVFHGPNLNFRHSHADGMSGSHFDAFPSGHTATAFAAATTLSDFYGNHPWVSYVSYAMASGVAVSRITERTHWLSDCFLGAIIGIYSTSLVERLNYGFKEFSVLPNVDEQQYGLTLSVKL